MRRLSVLALAALASGCAAPVTRQAVAPVSGDALGLGSAPGPAIAQQWWRAFGDPQLDRLVADATTGSPTLAQALARVGQANAVLATRRAEDGPTATLNAQGQVSRLSGRYIIPPPYAGSTRFVGTATADLAWNLDLFGRQRVAIEGARASAAAALLDVEAARLSLAGAVVQTYLDVVRADAQAAIAARTIGTREGTVRLVQVRVRNRLASALDAQAATTLLAQARQALVRAQGGRVVATNALAALAGRGADYAAAIGPTTLRLDALPPLPAIIPADLLARRADVAADRARIEAAAAGKETARRAFYPNVNLAASAGLQAIGIGNFLSFHAATASVGPALRLPIFDNGALRADLAGATAALDLATADYNARVTGAVREAADAIARSRELAADRAAQREVVRGYTETGRLNGIRVASGLESRLDLVDNDIRTLEAEQDDADLAANAAQQRVALIQALGGGFEPGQDGTR